MTTTEESPRARAWRLAVAGEQGAEDAISIRGAINDYNSRGRGETIARRVYRDGSWAWVSRPAARGRFLAADRRDVQHGDVYEAELVAEYTLGGDKAPDSWFMIIAAEKPLVTLRARKVRDGFVVTCPVAKDAEELLLGEIRVTDPYWR